MDGDMLATRRRSRAPQRGVPAAITPPHHPRRLAPTVLFGGELGDGMAPWWLRASNDEDPVDSKAELEAFAGDDDFLDANPTELEADADAGPPAYGEADAGDDDDAPPVTPAATFA